ncbi:MAG: DUF3048 domain-containing protein [Patescibacteria group bacterium]|nr:DUF3048 domain-containing protein [Patescibacteria group bacterium]
MLEKKRKKRFLIISLSILFGLAIGAAGFVAYKQYGPQKTENKKITIKPSPSPQTTANPLDGTQVSKDMANRHPLAIIIENHSQARPQVGLDKASIVYEAISEGGITRFMAIYGPQDAQKAGPVRSLRTYFLDWAWEYNAFIAHVGGNIDALDRVSQEKALDLDEFALGDKAYWREPEAGKAIEHTMYTSTEKLYAQAQSKGWDMKGDFTSFKFLKTKDFKINTSIKQEIIIDFSAPQYKVSYTWDSLNNNYPRTLAGAAHKDRNTGNQLAPTNIIIQSVNRTEGLTRINENSWTMQTIGEGKAYILYGGQKFDATWKKTDLKSRTMFYDSSGKEISFLPGQFWYEIVPPDVFDKISIKTESSTPTP